MKENVRPLTAREKQKRACQLFEPLEREQLRQALADRLKILRQVRAKGGANRIWLVRMLGPDEADAIRMRFVDRVDAAIRRVERLIESIPPAAPGELPGTPIVAQVPADDDFL
jgi:hypothetical protein